MIQKASLHLKLFFLPCSPSLLPGPATEPPLKPNLLLHILNVKKVLLLSPSNDFSKLKHVCEMSIMKIKPYNGIARASFTGQFSLVTSCNVGADTP